MTFFVHTKFPYVTKNQCQLRTNDGYLLRFDRYEDLIYNITLDNDHNKAIEVKITLFDGKFKARSVSLTRLKNWPSGLHDEAFMVVLEETISSDSAT